MAVMTAVRLPSAIIIPAGARGAKLSSSSAASQLLLQRLSQVSLLLKSQANQGCNSAYIYHHKSEEYCGTGVATLHNIFFLKNGRRCLVLISIKIKPFRLDGTRPQLLGQRVQQLCEPLRARAAAIQLCCQRNCGNADF